MPTTTAGWRTIRDNRCFSQAVPRTSALQHASQLSAVERSYVAKYPGELGVAVRALCQELLNRLAAANAKSAAASPPAVPPPAAPASTEASERPDREIRRSVRLARNEFRDLKDTRKFKCSSRLLKSTSSWNLMPF